VGRAQLPGAAEVFELSWRLRRAHPMPIVDYLDARDAAEFVDLHAYADHISLGVERVPDPLGDSSQAAAGTRQRLKVVVLDGDVDPLRH
jgi:hypothetical protein